ncbi:putative HPr kinase/phosphorylase [Sphingomonas changbaiensis NBRC 104936]|uniref:Putative HPr kinase/phosphorylase n=1 Tax=Sphingomonas changbaiensis NBRC 104936 TaxID=1219043 RepID=A0A0E9MLP0_9SPHN|nr:HPr kinase/phosphatase C-terminal domain-containing protein [Sphingomonas changbaiensis]GAO38439.1 putative HPr kinase/phosphorylase [Sphingomonas changbaiensis NBRC 104936]
MSVLLHASCVAIDGRAVLITGESGAGKSDLALRLIDRGAALVSDDQVRLNAVDGQLIAAAPDTIAGQIEVRGLGIMAMAHRSPMPVSLLIELGAPIERMPEPRSRELCGIGVPAVALDPFEAVAPIKAELALRELGLRQ